jgi:hypothetical protein
MNELLAFMILAWVGFWSILVPAYLLARFFFGDVRRDTYHVIDKGGKNEWL